MKLSHTGQGVLLAALISFTPVPVIAQEALFDPVQLTTECQIGTCQYRLDEILASLRTRGLPAEDLNSQISLLSAVVLDASTDASAEILVQLSGALSTLASASTDGAQQQAIRETALAVARGEGALFNTASPFAVSPTRPPARPWWRRRPSPRPQFRPGRRSNPGQGNRRPRF